LIAKKKSKLGKPRGYGKLHSKRSRNACGDSLGSNALLAKLARGAIKIEGFKR
jgi:hypothetical protein